MEKQPPPSSSSTPNYFTKDWQRPSPSIVTTENANHPCLVCGKLPSSSSSSKHKKCSQCHIATYCSTSCQRLDYTMGRHKVTCKVIGDLWKEKENSEAQLWNTNVDNIDNLKNGDNNNDEEENTISKGKECRPIVGQFWYDHPSTHTQKLTTSYCVCLLKLVQLLGRDESWRIAKSKKWSSSSSSENKGENDAILKKAKEKRIQMAASCKTTNPFDDDYEELTTTIATDDDDKEEETIAQPPQNNALALHHALNLSLNLLHLDRTDGRIRLLIPSLYLQLQMYQEAYDYIKFWLLPESNAKVVGMMEHDPSPPSENEENEEEEEGGGEQKELLPLPLLQNQDMTEEPECWMNVDSVYTGAGMVFELAFIKCIMMMQVQKYEEQHGQYCEKDKNDNGENNIETKELVKDEDMPPLSWIKTGSIKLKRQVHLLLSIVHDLNPNLLPHFAHYDRALHKNKPAATDSLLNLHPPGFELQYKMGNCGGRSIEEAVSIWQRDMIVWHVVDDDDAMMYLSDFCSDLSSNVVDLNVLRIDDDGTGTKRAEAEELAARLQRENPDLSADGIMMHPDMASLMLKHLNNE